MTDITIIYLTASRIPKGFQVITRMNLIKASHNADIISVSKKPTEFGVVNIVTEGDRSHVGIYRDALLGAEKATTKYIAIAEDDVLYSEEHFQKRPTSDDVFSYNIACWSIYTWSNPPIFSYSGRRNFGQLICHRDLFIRAMEERFEKYPDDALVNNAIWAEPGKYESQLGVTPQKSEIFYTDPANVMFSHPEGLSMNTIGYRKRLAPIRAYEIPHWGRAEAVAKYYE